MILYKNHVSDYLRCPYLFGRNVTSTRQSSIKIIEHHANIKRHIAEIACYELKNEDKLPLAEYRTRYTNKHKHKGYGLKDAEKLTKDLNKLFEIFANSAFIGYNVPIDIPISGTSLIYRDIVDFLVTDTEGNITAIEIDDLSNIDMYKRYLAEYPHYYSVYSFLASSFDQEISVAILDPNDITRLDTTFSTDRIDNDLIALGEVLKPMQSCVLLKNYYACKGCEYIIDCCGKES